MPRALIAALPVAIILCCRREPAPIAAGKGVGAPRRQLVTASDRVPPKDAIDLGDGLSLKLIREGSGPVVGRPGTDFSGYGFTFFSDDGYDTGTSLEMKTWDKTNDLERRILGGRKGGDTLRLWNCARRTKMNQCVVSDYMVFGRLGT
jgi:hypothetical protein